MRVPRSAEEFRMEILERSIIETLSDIPSVVDRLGSVGATVSAESSLCIPDCGLGHVIAIEGPVPVSRYL